MKNFAIPALVLTAAIAGCDGSQSSGATTASSAQSGSTLSPVAEAGRAKFGACSVCHTTQQGDASRVGPNLFGVAGSLAAQIEDFAYSSAMRDSGVVWTDENLDAYLENPQQFMPGNRMAYVGERNGETRTALIEYLKTLK